MKKFIILAIIFGLASNSSLAMKREREEEEQAPAGESENKESKIEQKHAPVFQLLEQHFRSNTDPLSQEITLLRYSNDEIVRSIEFINSNNFQNKFPMALAAFNNRIFVKCNDDVIRHFNKLILNNMVTIKDMFEDRLGPITLVEPLPIPIMPMREFIALYQITATYIAQSQAQGFTQLSNATKIQNLIAPLQTILYRNNFTATELLVAAFYLALPDLVLDALARETAIEIKKIKKAFPALSHAEIAFGTSLQVKDPGIVYTEFLPDNVKALSKDILASVLRQFFLINPNETQPRLISRCYHKDDIFCLKTLQFDLPMKPFSIAELLQYKKIIIRNNILDLRRMNINDVTGFENIRDLNKIKALLLGSNRLQQLPANFLNNCPVLQGLWLNNNQLQELPVNFLHNCAQLKLLMLQNNQLPQLPENFLNNCPQVQELRLEYNKLSQLPVNFLNNCPQLLTLALQDNQLQQLPENFLNNCPQLKELRLNNNKLPELLANFLNNCPQLQGLALHDNQLQQLPENFLNNCPKLQMFGLDHNQLQQLPANFLSNCSELQALTLSNNQLRELPANFLHNAAKLRRFGLFNNQLSNETIEQIKETLLRQGKVVDGKNIILEPQKMEAKPE